MASAFVLRYEGDAAYKGMEIQILDDGAARYQGKLRPAQYHGSIYDVIPAKQGFKKPTGEWNQEEITAKGRKISCGFERDQDRRRRSGLGARSSRSGQAPRPGPHQRAYRIVGTWDSRRVPQFSSSRIAVRIRALP